MSEELTLAYDPRTNVFTRNTTGLVEQKVGLRINRHSKRKDVFYFYANVNHEILCPAFTAKIDLERYRKSEGNIQRGSTLIVYDQSLDQLRDNLQRLDISHSDDQSSGDEEMECSVCIEECKTMLDCRHRVHLECIARSGKQECPLCKQQVTLPPSLKTVCDRTKREMEQERKEQDTQESLRVAAELQRQLQPPRVTVLTFPTHRMRVTIDPEPIRWNVDEFTMEVCRLMMNSNTRTMSMNTTQSVVNAFQLIYSLNRLSVETGLNTEDLANVLAIVTKQ